MVEEEGVSKYIKVIICMLLGHSKVLVASSPLSLEIGVWRCLYCDSLVIMNE